MGTGGRTQSRYVNEASHTRLGKSGPLCPTPKTTLKFYPDRGDRCHGARAITQRLSSDACRGAHRGSQSLPFAFRHTGRSTFRTAPTHTAAFWELSYSIGSSADPQMLSFHNQHSKDKSSLEQAGFTENIQHSTLFRLNHTGNE